MPSSVRTKEERSSSEMTVAEAIRAALHDALAGDARVVLIGEGVPDPKNIFGTTTGLREKFGSTRVFDMPVSENGMTGVCIGAALNGLRPVMVHQRNDFMLYAFDQLVNNAAKWHSMFGMQRSIPLTVRGIIGRGWGQGNQHSQNLQTLFAHVPGLKVVAPSTPATARDLLRAAIRDPNPVIYLEHRWLHHVKGFVDDAEQFELGKARVARVGSAITLVSSSYYVLECLAAAATLAEQGIDVEVIDLLTIKPLDSATVFSSVAKTRRLLVVDGSWRFLGLAGEIIAQVAENEAISLDARPKRMTFPDAPVPSSPALANEYYPRASDIAREVGLMCGASVDVESLRTTERAQPLDVPNRSFTGPF